MTESILDDLATFNEEKKELELKRRSLYKKAVARVQELVSTFGIVAEDIDFSTDGMPVEKKTRRPVPPKFQNPNGNETWSGRGVRPRWFSAALEAGFSEEDMLIKKTAED